MESGVVHRSSRSISAPEVWQMLQKTVPVIMQTSRREKPQCTGPRSNSTLDSPTVSSTKATETEMRFPRE